MAGPVPAADDRAMIRSIDSNMQAAPGEAPPLAPRLADDDRKRRGEPGQPGSAVITKTRPQTKRPNMYRVLLLNDDYTPMEFVVHVLERFFNKDRESATRIMLHVHQNGIGRDKSDAGDGLCPQTPASFAVRDGEEVA